MATKVTTIDEFAKFYVLGEITDKLKEPFPLETIYWKPQSVTRDGTRALGAPYGDTRAYEDRLNEVCPEQWTTAISYIPLPQTLVCVVELSVCGVIRGGDGDADIKDGNVAASAYAQAFKRACSRFGLGRYLYDLPKTWVAYDKEKKTFTTAGRSALDQMYIRETKIAQPIKQEPAEPTVDESKASAPAKKAARSPKRIESPREVVKAPPMDVDDLKHITDMAAKLVDDNGQQRYVLTIAKVRDNLMSALAIHPRPLNKLTVREGGLIYWYLQSQVGKTGDELAAIKERGKVIAGYAMKDSLTWEEAQAKYAKDVEGK